MLRILALPVVLFALCSARADEAAPRISTENAEYCESLAARLAASPAPMGDISRGLGEEGRRLCASGHVRTGIAKLRRALRATRAEARGD
ncbi:hypothetical protein [Sediminicoccus sp. KRV36]|uniref:hypothetical protein n=1 Tax=Sediminicoccus sp. KRV36 TaxID=3133721 RepID=UPI00200BF373|nr:hypothetical protein [Sediminicoccus rosea]UPY36467.1 hypothetical protein LHU95_19940 [Sediminicoccus rosea]